MKLGILVKVLIGIVLSAIVAVVALAGFVFVRLEYYDPWLHRTQHVPEADRLNDVSYDIGDAIAYQGILTAELSGRPVTAASSLFCLPKHYALPSSLKNRPHIWQRSYQVGPASTRIELGDGRQLVARNSDYICGLFQFGGPLKPAWSASGDVVIEAPNGTCTIFYGRDNSRIVIGSLVIERPHVSKVEITPIRSLMTRLEYGSSTQDGVDWGPPPRSTDTYRKKPRFYWRPELNCWEDADDSQTMEARNSGGTSFDLDKPICSQRGREICGFGN